MFLLLLWYVGPALSAGKGLADRLFGMLAAGVAIGVALGLAGCLTPVGCWAAAALAAAIRYLAMRGHRDEPIQFHPGFAAICGLTAVAAWPGLVRPVSDGDSLIYHLPNAASWVFHHSLYSTDTHYWWYPGASELFAAVLLAVGGTKLLAVAGLLPFALLGLLILEWPNCDADKGWRRAWIATAFLSSFAVATQAADLQNDVWLTATFAFALRIVAQRDTVNQSTIALTVLSLIKANGLLYASLLALAGIARQKRVSTLAAIGIVTWAVRNVVLLPHAVIGPWQNGPLLSTTILAHGIGGITLVVASAFRDDFSTLLFTGSGFSAICLSRNSIVRIAAAGSIALFLLNPFGFEGGGVQHLALGDSLRYGMPAMLCGALVMVTLGETLGPVSGYAFDAAFLLMTWVNVDKFTNLYWAAAHMHFIILVGVSAALFTFALRKLNPRALLQPLVALGAVSLLIAAWQFRDPYPEVSFYNEWLHEPDGPSSLAVFLSSTHGGSVVAVNFPVGVLNALNPGVRGIDGLSPGFCAEAALTGATVVVHDVADNPMLAEEASTCGKATWRNGRDEAISPGKP